MGTLKSIQALRAIAANLVILTHLVVVEGKFFPDPLLPHVAYYGMLGVDIFFVLSGFVMLESIGGKSAGKFIRARCVRIYPAYWVATTAVLLVFLYNPDLVNSSYAEPTSIWKSYLLIPQKMMPLLGIGWTLIFEMYFYIVLALLLALRAPLIPGLAVWALLILALAPFAHGPIGQTATSPYCFEFLMGALISWLRPARWKFGASVLVIGVALLCVGIWRELYTGEHVVTYAGWPRIAVFGVPAALIVFGAVSLEQNGRLRAPDWLSRIGDYSYSTYLFHTMVVSALGYAVAALPHALAVAALVAGGLVLSNLVGLLSYKCIERPAMAWGKAKAARLAA